MMTIDALKEHIDHVAAENHITTCFKCVKPGRASAAFPQMGHICMVPVTDHKSYSIGLHELGHLLDPDGTLLTAGATLFCQATGLLTPTDVDLMRRQEQAAWRWAEAHALIWTEEMSQYRDYCLNTYEERFVQEAQGYNDAIQYPLMKQLIELMSLKEAA